MKRYIADEKTKEGCFCALFVIGVLHKQVMNRVIGRGFGNQFAERWHLHHRIQ
jgi:hypothetical protein